MDKKYLAKIIATDNDGLQMISACTAGAKVKVCGPSSFMPKHLEALNVEHISNLKDALQWCDIANVLRIQLERQDVNLSLIQISEPTRPY